jgi:lipid II:glycine glycyltransferase (peptidoglycan interpeptide bridge formation enzyme)
MSLITPEAWTDFLSQYPDAHILQTAAWGELKSGFDWQVAHVVAGSSGAQILFRKLPLGLSFAYIPKGPVGDDWDRLWPEVDSICKEKRAVFLKVEADLWEGDSDSIEGGQPPSGFHLSLHEIQPPRTLIVDLQGTEDQILARMKQKTRYNIRLARRKGIIIRETSDIDTFYQLMQVTGERDAFGVHSREYYHRVLDLFEPRGHCRLFCAEFEEQPLAGLMVFAYGKRAWYFYGASSNEYRHLMPTYLLQWKAMQWAKAQGSTEYDLWGVPDEDQETLEANFLERRDGLWGVYRFKRGFGGEIKRVVQTWDRVYSSLLYKLYLWRMGSPGSK